MNLSMMNLFAESQSNQDEPVCLYGVCPRRANLLNYKEFIRDEFVRGEPFCLQEVNPQKVH